MPLPFTLVFTPPTRATLRRALRRPGCWVLVVTLGLIVAGVAILVRAHRPPREIPSTVPLTVTSAPQGATILIDGRARGRTSTSLLLAPGQHRVTLRLPRYADADYMVRATPGQPSVLRGLLWLQTPQVRRLRPPVPGAAIAAAQFLADGRLALTLALPPGDERQLWLLDQAGGARRIGPPEAQAALAVAPDGRRVAYLARPTPAPPAAPASVDARVSEVWITTRDGERGERRYALPAGTADERLVDLSWAPDGTHLLLASRLRPQGGGARTRLLWLDPASGVARELARFPSEIVPGSYLWRPDGAQVAFLTHNDSRVALCLLGTSGDLFRYLTDVPSAGGTALTPVPFPPLAWAPAGNQIAYTALPVDGAGAAAGGWFGPVRGPALYTDDLSGWPSRRVGDAGGQGPGWREDGRFVVLARPKRNGPLVLRLIEPDGTVHDGSALPLPAATVAGVRWDLARGVALVALGGAGGIDGGALDLWLVRWTESDQEARR